MPELPEVETMRRGLLPLVGQRVIEAIRPPCRRKPIVIAPRWDAFCRRTVGRTITELGRVGKRVVVVLDSGDRMVIEPRMTGLVSLTDVPTSEHLRLIIRTESLQGSKAPKQTASPGCQNELLYWDRRGLGSVRLVDDAEFAQRYGGEKLGPDALAITVEELRVRLASSRRAIKVALLDQRALAGIGNLYASELLHVAGVNPTLPCDRLGEEQWTRVHCALQSVLEEAIRYEGSTLSDGTYRNAVNKSGGYQNCHRVYDRAGKPCPTCELPIERIVQAQRSTFFCPACQSTKRVARRKPEKSLPPAHQRG